MRINLNVSGADKIRKSFKKVIKIESKPHITFIL